MSSPRGQPDPADDRERNGVFYATEPHTYFARRVDLLLVHIARPSSIPHALASGVEAGNPLALSSMTRDIGYHHRYDPDLTCADC